MPALETFRGHVKPSMCDHLGHMNLGRYLEICGDGVFYLQSRLGLDVPTQHNGFSFAAVHADSQFLAEVRFGEALRLETGVLDIGTKSCTFDKRIFAGKDSELVFIGRLKSAFMDLSTRRAVEIPDTVRAALLRFSV